MANYGKVTDRFTAKLKGLNRIILNTLSETFNRSDDQSYPPISNNQHLLFDCDKRSQHRQA